MSTRTRANTQTAERASRIAEQMVEYVKTFGHMPWQSGLIMTAVKESITGYITENTILGSSGTPYTGANLMLAAMAIEKNGWTCRHFFTFNRVKELGGSVNPGAKATFIQRAVFGYFLNGERLTEKEAREAQKNGEEVLELYLGIREYCVFNGEQTTLDWQKIDAEEREKAKEKTKQSESKFRQDIKAEDILNNYTRGCEIYYTSPKRGDGTYYPTADYIEVAPPTAYKTPANFYSTLFHEMIHATSHKTRLNRKIGGAFGSSEYAKEEMIAEFGASLLMTFSDSGVGQTIDNSTNYLSGWAKRITDEGADFSKVLAQAIPKSIQAVEFILFNGEKVAA